MAIAVLKSERRGCPECDGATVRLIVPPIGQVTGLTRDPAGVGWIT